MKKLLSLTKYKKRLIVYILLQMVATALALLPPYCYLLFLNEVLENSKMEMLGLVVILYLSVYAMKTLVSVLQRYMYNLIFPVMTLEVKDKVLRRYDQLTIKEVNSYQAGELKECLHKDSENVVLYLQQRVELVISLISIVITTGILLYLNWILALVSFLLLPFSFLITRTIKKKNNVQYERRRQMLSKYDDFMIHDMSFWKELKANNMADKQQEQFDLWWKDLGIAFYKSHIFWFLNRTFLAFKDVFLTKMGLYLLGGLLVIRKVATVATLLTFMEYYTDYVNRLLAVSDIVMKRGEQEVSLKRVKNIINGSDIKDDSKILTNSTDESTLYRIPHFEKVEFKQVTFNYEEDKPILQNFNLQLNRGERLAVVGESGCGKSTMIRLLAGFEEPVSGEILWNDIPREKCEKRSIYENVGFLMQESTLFNLSIRENLQFGKEDADEEELWDACKRANMDEFIKGLSEGFDTIIGENGIKLSGGQRQRLLIARLFLQNPEMIVFDEATSALDYQNESEILNLLLQEKTEKITFVMITHRQTSLARCDRILQM